MDVIKFIYFVFAYKTNMKKHVAVVTGGYSGEAQIAFKSAKTVLDHIDPNKFEVTEIHLTKEKTYGLINNDQAPLDWNDFSLTVNQRKITFDLAFIVIHGTPGEDGKLQGYFDMIGMPYIGCSQNTSAVTFNKSICKSVVKEIGIHVCNSLVVRKGDRISTEQILEHVSLPCFIKPNNGGSSIGVSKVHEASGILPAIEKGLKEDCELIIEDFILGTEVTCGVLKQKGEIKALGVTEIVSKNEFFDFEAKYKDDLNEEITPARLPEEKLTECMRISERIFAHLQCEGIARIDYILSGEDFYMIEVNTIPGMSAESILPKQAKAAGLNLTEMFTGLIEERLAG